MEVSSFVYIHCEQGESKGKSTSGNVIIPTKKVYGFSSISSVLHDIKCP